MKKLLAALLALVLLLSGSVMPVSAADGETAEEPLGYFFGVPYYKIDYAEFLGKKMPPLILRAEVDGEWKTDAQGERYFAYDCRSCFYNLHLDGLGYSLSIHYDQMRALYAYTPPYAYRYYQDGQEIKETFEKENLVFTDTQCEEHWTAGNTYCATLHFGGAEIPLYFTVVDSDVIYFVNQYNMKCHYLVNYTDVPFETDEELSYEHWIYHNGHWYYGNYSRETFARVEADYWLRIGANSWYYLNPDGTMRTGWFLDKNNKWYYFNKSGLMLKSWQKIGGKWYYFNYTGDMVTGWLRKGYGTPGHYYVRWYYMNPDGSMRTGWVKSGKYWYYLDGHGRMVTGRRKINGKWYRFSDSGACLNP